MSKASEFAVGFRALADFLEANQDVEMPYFSPMLCLTKKEDMNAWVRALAARDGKVDKDFDEKFLNIRPKFGPIQFEIYIGRDKVCERVVTGKELVKTKVIMNPSDILYTEITEERDIVEWRCGSLLADNSEQGAN